MKSFYIFLFMLIAACLPAQQLISNKGNRNQTYPKVTEVNPEIKAMVDQVSMQNLENSIRWMQDLGCRNAADPEALETQNWLIDHFESFGLDVYVHHFLCSSGYGSNCGKVPCTGDTLAAGNVVAIQWGTEFPDEYIIVSSHYDHPDGPGADDNASGTAGVIEIARLLSQHQFKRSIMYVPFNAEEYWMVGSLPFVEKCAREEMNILGCFNLDMIGFFPGGVGPLTMYSGSSYISDRLWNYYKTVANIYVTDIPTRRFSVGDSYGGDHMPFNMYAYPALYIGDTEYHHQNHCYHQLCDTLGAGVNSLPLAQGFVRATLASVAELANGWLAPQNLSAIPGDGKITISWDAAPETEQYKLYKNNVLLKETTETSYIDNVNNGTEYVYHVAGIHSVTGKESPESNRDTMMASLPLELPYFNDFEESMATLRPNNPGWQLSDQNPYSGQKSLTNTTAQFLPDNLLSIIELKSFSIPDTTTHISLQFMMRGTIESNWKATGFFVEVTTDRKKWDKLLQTVALNNTWSYFQIPLNQYIGENFVQIRFRLESSGQSIPSRKRQVFIDDLKIDFSPGSGYLAPQNLTITKYTTNNVSLKWDAVNNIRGYTIYRNGKKVNNVPLTSTTFLDVIKTYPDLCYHVTAVYTAQESDFSNEACIRDVGINENLRFSDVQIIPNPTTGIINIATGLDQPYHVAVYNLQGIKVFEKELFTDGTMDLSRLPKGFYLLKITTAKVSITKKMVLQ